jgi:hypothetical protein
MGSQDNSRLLSEEDEMSTHTRLGLALTLGLISVLASKAASGADLGLQVTDTTTFDQLDLVNQAPGESDTAVAQGARVSSFNGNLLLGEGLSNVFPQDSNLGSFFFGATYNSHHVRKYHVRTGAASFGDYLTGRSWVGLGWSAHMGRIVRRSKYRLVNGTWDYFLSERYFEFPDGSLYRFEPTVIPAAPALEIHYYPDCVGIPPSHSCPPCQICDTIPDATCCECVPDSTCDGRQSDPVEHYDVNFPDGTKYRLERIVTETGVGEWVSNEDRNGFYTTRITDVFGNSVSIAYQRSGPYPEAIGLPPENWSISV